MLAAFSFMSGETKGEYVIEERGTVKEGRREEEWQQGRERERRIA